MSRFYYIRAQVIGALPSGQKRVQLMANNADGISFYTDDASLLTVEDLRPDTPKAPVEIDDVGGDTVTACPTCGASAIWNPYRKNWPLYPHCPWCGQKLKSQEEGTA